MNFKPTIFTFIIIIAFVGFCSFQIPIAGALPYAGGLLGTIILWYQFGKLSIKRQITEEDFELKNNIQAEQIEEILNLKIMDLFPDISDILREMAADKYEALGDIQKAHKLRTETANAKLNL
jgi:hypothetical protein